MRKNLSLYLCYLLLSMSADAAVRTNVNALTDFYEKNIEAKERFFGKFHDENNRAVESIKSGSNHEMLEGYETRENMAASLRDIRAVELEGLGRHASSSEEYRFYDENELEPNWSKAGNRMHKEDAEEIALATSNLFADLMDKLRELGLVDCKSKKGPKVKEPVYMIEVKREEQSNTEYDQFFCEELKNSYSCNDTLKLRCSEQGMKWGPWQYKEIDIPGNIVYHGAKHLGYAVHWKKKRNGWHLSDNSAGWRVFLANYLKIPLEQIHDTVSLPVGARGIGGTYPVYEDWRVVFDYYRFGYHFRTGALICTVWSEDWLESCRLR